MVIEVNIPYFIGNFQPEIICILASILTIMPTEVIDSHFYNLIRMIRGLQDNNVVFMNYIENDWTWIKFEREDEKITVSELKRKHDNLVDGNSLNPELVAVDYFENAELVSEEYIIDYSQFVSEVNSKLIDFINILKSTNMLLVKNKHLQRVIEYYNLIL